ncbi:MAG: integrase catalytic domain-containing protein, partial [Alistipes sp.]|nr:integrase catalytic domain-containing protein [Alistipes sp.]
ASTPIKPRHEEVRKAFLFSCLTGLRVSDIVAITWGQVSKVGTMTRITFKQKKTQGLQYLDINEQAAELMGEQRSATEHIFHLHSLNLTNTQLRKWVQSAGISKHISFHSGRHTFAVMMLDLGADIYTVQKLLGHRNINTTQIYAKILDKNKQEAVQRIPKIMI